MELKGVQVLELANGIAAPYAGLLLAGLGANVIKIEPPKTGDEARRLEPRKDGDVSAFFLAYNLGKKSVTLDLQKPHARKAFHALVKSADVVLVNGDTDTIRQKGADYAGLKKINPGLVYCSVSGYGQTGPYQNREACDLVAQARFGMMATTGEDYHGEPIRTGYPVTEVCAGINAAFATVAALLHRRKTGKGQFVETTLMHTQMSLAGHVATQQDFALANPNHSRALCLQLAPYQAYRAKDGWVVVATSNEAQWERICALPAFAALSRDSRFATIRQRVQHRCALAAVFEKIFQHRTTSDVEALFEKADVPCTRVNRMADIFANDVFREATLDAVEGSGAGPLSVPKIPFSFETLPLAPRQPAPAPGEHNQSVLNALGYTPAEIENICA